MAAGQLVCNQAYVLILYGTPFVTTHLHQVLMNRLLAAKHTYNLATHLGLFNTLTSCLNGVKLSQSQTVSSGRVFTEQALPMLLTACILLMLQPPGARKPSPGSQAPYAAQQT